MSSVPILPFSSNLPDPTRSNLHVYDRQDFVVAIAAVDQCVAERLSAGSKTMAGSSLAGERDYLGSCHVYDVLQE